MDEYKDEKSPEPEYDAQGRRTNTRRQRGVKKIMEEKQKCVRRMMELRLKLGGGQAEQIRAFLEMEEKNKKWEKKKELIAAL